MENTLATILIVICLLVGAVGGAVLAPEKVITEVETKTVTETVYQNVTVDKIVEVPAISQLDLAVAEFMKAVENEEDEAGNDVDVLGDYYFDEIVRTNVEDYYTVEYDGDEIEVEFSINLRFDDGDDRVKENYDVLVIFEEDEDTIVEATLI